MTIKERYQALKCKIIKWKKELIFVVLALVVNSVALWPLLSSGYYGDDYANSLVKGGLLYNHTSLFDFTYSIFMGWLKGQGRFTPLLWYGYSLFYVNQSLLIYKIGSLLSVFFAFSLFSRFLYLLSRDRNLSLMILFMPSVFVQFRNYHDPVTGYGYLLPGVFIFIIGSFIFLMRYLESGGQTKLIGSILFFLIPLLTYEVSFAYIIIIPFLIYWKTGSLKRVLFVSSPFFMCVFIFVSLSLYFRSIATGIVSTYKVAFSVGTYFSTLWGHILAAFPFIYYRYNLLPSDANGIKGLLIGSSFSAYISSICVGISIAMLTLRIQWQNILKLLIISLMFLVLPLCIISLSVKFQNLPIGIGYLPVFCAYAGAMLLTTLGVTAVLHFIKKSVLRIIVSSCIGILMACLFLVNSYANKMVVEEQSKTWKYPRCILENAVKAGLMKNIPEGSRILLTTLPTGWESAVLKDLFCLYGGKRFYTTDLASLNAEITSKGEVENPGNLYALKHVAESSDQGYVILGKVVKVQSGLDGLGQPNLSAVYIDNINFYAVYKNCAVLYGDGFLKSGSMQTAELFLPTLNNIRTQNKFLLLRDVFAGGKIDLFSMRISQPIDKQNLKNDLNSEVIEAFTSNADRSVVVLNTGTNVPVDMKGNIVGYRKVLAPLNAVSILDKVKFGKSFTIECLVKLGRQKAPYAHIIGNHPGRGGHDGFALQALNNEKNRFTFGYGTGTEWGPSVSFIIEPDVWQYLALIVGDNSIRVYKNGILVGQIDGLAPISESAYPVMIGDWANLDRTLNGVVPVFAVSYATLSSGQITEMAKKLDNIISEDD